MPPALPITDCVAFCVLQACHALKYSVPDEVAVIGCNDDEFLCQIAVPSLSSIPVPAHEIGFNAAHLLDHLMGRRELPPEQMVFQPAPAHVRESTDRVSTVSNDLAVALHFIREHSAERVYVQDVVSAVGIPRRTLELLFQRNVKCGIHEHICQAHLLVAERLLRDDKLTRSEIARQSGFPNATCKDSGCPWVH
jgi:LacI family transcriptional regulator